MKRSQLKTKYFKTNVAESLRSYKKQKNFWIKLFKKERKKYYNSLKLNKVTDNETFWTTIWPFLSEKGTNINKITLKVNYKVISDDKQLCKTFSKRRWRFYVLVTILMSNYSDSDPVNNAVRKYENHPSVKKIREKHFNKIP